MAQTQEGGADQWLAKGRNRLSNFGRDYTEELTSAAENDLVENQLHRW